jgi:hypothetical protein
MTGRRLADLAFEPWVEHVFSHTVSYQGAAWYFDVDADIWDGPSALTVRHLTRLFDDPEAALEYFSDAQIAQGLYYLIDSGAGGLVLSLLDEAVPLPARQECLGAIPRLFERLLEPRVAPALGHRDEKGARPLNMVTYMWWDIFPVAATANPGQPPDPINAAILGGMDRILGSRHPAIQESALHGLGHWASAFPDETAAIIDAYLARAPGIRPELLAYARAARKGCVL